MRSDLSTWIFSGPSAVPGEVWRIPGASAKVSRRPQRNTVSGMKTVLVIDPNEDDRLITSVVVTHAGYTPVAASSAPEAQAILEQRRIDAIVTALALNGGTCHDFVKRLQAAPATRDVPIIVASQYWDVFPTEAEALPVAATIQKPVTHTGLADILHRLLGEP